MTGIRSIVAVTALGLILLVFKRSAFKLRNPRKDIPFILVFGLFGQAAMSYTYLEAIAHNPVGIAILMHYLAPVFSLFIGIIFLRHKPRLMAFAGVACAVVGCALVVGITSPAGLAVTPVGFAWGMSAAFFFSLYAVMGQRAKDKIDPVTLLFYGLLVSTVLWLIVAGPKAIFTPIFTPETSLAVLGVGLFSTLLPFFAFLTALRSIPAVNAGITAMAEPILAVIGGAVLFAESITLSFIVGGVFIIGAIVLIQVSDAWSTRP
jgi:drug/metabolite transporter (DMT)-like permease